MRQEIKLDSKGIPFKYPTQILDKAEFSKIVSEINSLYYSMYETDAFGLHYSVDVNNDYCLYYFENHGFNDYNIYDKIYI